MFTNCLQFSCPLEWSTAYQNFIYKIDFYIINLRLCFYLYRYREGKYPENMETFTILNTSPLEADLSFCFLHDSKAETYLLEPPTMLLKPGESEKLTVWAYPKGKY